MNPLAKILLASRVFSIPIPDPQWTQFVEICGVCNLDYEVEAPQLHRTLVRMKLGDYNRYVMEREA